MHLVMKLEMRPLVKCRYSWEKNIKMDIRKIVCENMDSIELI